MEMPKVGVGVIVVKDGKVLLQKRIGSHGSGTWCFPGRHLEFNEELEECARRETLEELGINIKNAKFVAITNDLFKVEGKHYITVFMLVTEYEGEPKIIEPEKCEKWEWCSWHDLPQPLFIPIQNLLKQKFNPFSEK